MEKSFLQDIFYKTIDIWLEELKNLYVVAEREPHAAFTHGLSNKWLCFSAICMRISDLPSILDGTIPLLTGVPQHDKATHIYFTRYIPSFESSTKAV